MQDYLSRVAKSRQEYANRLATAIAARPHLRLFVDKHIYRCRPFTVLSSAQLNSDRSAESDQPLFFVVGSGRSGNTLLRRLLMDAAPIYILPETYVLGPVIQAWFKTQGLSWPERVKLVLGMFEYQPEFDTFGVVSLQPFAIEAENWGDQQRNLESLVVGLYNWIAVENGATVCAAIGDKTPLNTLYLAHIRAVFPNAKFIYMKRDGVDVCASYVDSGIHNSLHAAAVRWRLSVNLWRRFSSRLGRHEKLEVSYEQLVKQPDVVINDVLKMLNVSRATRSSERSAASLGDVAKHKHHAEVLKEPTVANIGKGRARLSSKQLERLRPVLNETLVSSGYESI